MHISRTYKGGSVTHRDLSSKGGRLKINANRMGMNDKTRETEREQERRACTDAAVQERGQGAHTSVREMGLTRDMHTMHPIPG